MIKPSKVRTFLGLTMAFAPVIRPPHSRNPVGVPPHGHPFDGHRHDALYQPLKRRLDPRRTIIEKFLFTALGLGNLFVAFFHHERVYNIFYGSPEQFLFGAAVVVLAFIGFSLLHEALHVGD